MIIFDLDGTLFDTASAFIPACKDFFKEYERPYPGDSEVMTLVGETEAYFKQWLIEQGFLQDFKTLRDKMIQLEVMHIYSSGKLFDGISELLTELKHRQQTIALCSNAVPAYQQAVFTKTNISSYIDVVRLPQHEQDTKVNMVRELIASYPTQAGTIIIGDRKHDIAAGKANGIITVGCVYGYGGDEIKEADYIVQSASALLHLLTAKINVV